MTTFLVFMVTLYPLVTGLYLVYKCWNDDSTDQWTDAAMYMGFTGIVLGVGLMWGMARMAIESMPS